MRYLRYHERDIASTATCRLCVSMEEKGEESGSRGACVSILPFPSHLSSLNRSRLDFLAWSIFSVAVVAHPTYRIHFSFTMPRFIPSAALVGIPLAATIAFAAPFPQPPWRTPVGDFGPVTTVLPGAPTEGSSPFFWNSPQAQQMGPRSSVLRILHLL